MKKVIYFLAFASLVLSSCGSKDNPNDPSKKGEFDFMGDWYCTHEKVDAQLQMTFPQFFSLDTTVSYDTTYVEPQLYTLTRDYYLLIDGDTISGYRYDELDGKLYVSIRSMLSQSIIPADLLKTLGISDTVAVTFNYSKTNARAAAAINESGLLMNAIPYLIKADAQMDFKR